jgi:holliday junction DNA helicase RuvA
MLTRITGILESVNGIEAIIAMGDVARQVLVPAYEAERLQQRIGERITLHTLEYLENQGQGSSYIPRLIGFAAVQDRRFFELLTTLDGFGNRRALRILAHEPAAIARAILGSDSAWLTRLPEIGKKTAEKVILELKGKVQPFLDADEIRGLDAAAGGARGDAERAGSPAAAQAIAALVTLGESRAEAERLVGAACARDRGLSGADATAEQIIAAALGAAWTGT